MAGQEYSDHVKAAALAALLAGQSFGEVARLYGVPVGTLKSWKARTQAASGVVAPDASEKRQRIGELLLEYLQTTIETLVVQQQVFRDKEWLLKQSAAEVATLHGLTVDKAVRLLEGLADDTAEPGPPVAD